MSTSEDGAAPAPTPPGAPAAADPPAPLPQESAGSPADAPKPPPPAEDAAPQGPAPEPAGPTVAAVEGEQPAPAPQPSELVVASSPAEAGHAREAGGQQPALGQAGAGAAESRADPEVPTAVGDLLKSEGKKEGEPSAEVKKRGELFAAVTAPIATLTIATDLLLKAQRVFVPPPAYAKHYDALDANQRIWIVGGLSHSGRFTCALNLGLALRGQGRAPDPELYGGQAQAFAQRDLHAYYKSGIKQLRRRLEGPPSPGDDPFERDEDRRKVHNLEWQLEDNLANADEADSRRIVSGIRRQLNQIAIQWCAVDFETLCQRSGVSGDPAPPALPAFRLIPTPALAGRPLLPILEQDGAEEGSVYICERALEGGLLVQELDDRLRTHLNERKAYLILTADVDEQSVQGVANYIAADPPRDGTTSQSFLQKILESHLNYYAIRARDERTKALREQVEQIGERLCKTLRYPYAIDQFCDALRNLPADAQSDAIAALADSVAQYGPVAARQWFQSLNANERLYAMFVALFSGVGHLQLDELYARAVSFLRDEGVEGLGDARAFGLDELRARVRVRDNGSGLEFNHVDLANEAQSQIANYHHTLWSICEHVVQPQLAEQQAPQSLSRQSLGLAIGQVGRHTPHRLGPLLDDLADDDDEEVAATAGHVLDGVARGNLDQARWAADRLGAWARSKVPLRMWMASLAIWRVYRSVRANVAGQPDGSLESRVLEPLRATLSHLAASPGDFDEATVQAVEERAKAAAARRVAGGTAQNGDEAELKALVEQELKGLENEQIDALTYAVAQIARQSVRDAVGLVRGWLEALPASRQHWVGTIAALRLMEVEKGQKSPALTHQAFRAFLKLDGVESPPTLSRETHRPLLELVGPMLDAEERALRVLLTTLRRWASAEGWAEPVGATLFERATRAPWAERRQLARLIGELWVDAEPAVLAIAQQVIARSRLIDGWPADAAGDPVVVLVDWANPQVQQRAFGVRLAWTVADRIAAVTPVRDCPLGVTRVDEGYGRAMAAPRLAAPTLEACGGPASALGLVLAWTPVHDLEDLGQGPRSRRVIFSALGPELPCPPDVLPVVLPARRTISQAVDLLAGAALERLAQLMAERDAAAWGKRVAPLLDRSRLDGPGLEGQIAGWADELERPPASPAADPLRKLIATLCWLSAANLRYCVEMVLKLIASDQEARRIAGGAAARALLYLYGSAAAPPPVATHGELLRLVPPIAGQGWPAAEAALFAARSWAREEGWLHRLLGPPRGGDAELLQLVDRLGPDERRQAGGLIEAWTTPASAADAPRLAILAEILQLQLGKVADAAPPPLAPGERYALLVLPAAPLPAQADVAREAARALLGQQPAPLRPLICRLGQCGPLACPEPGQDLGKLDLSGAGAPAALLGPLLERFAHAEVGAVVLLGPALAWDEEDWHAGPWARKILLYRSQVAERVPFGVIAPASTAKDGGAAIAARLARPDTGL